MQTGVWCPVNSQLLTMYFDFHKNMNADINLLTRIISNGTDGKYGFCDSTQMGQFIGQFIFLSVRSIPLTLS